MTVVAAVSTAAGILLRPTVADIDRMLATPGAKFAPGDVDRLLDARLALRTRPAKVRGLYAAP